MLFSKRDIIRLLVPLVVEQMLAVTIGVADTVMVAYVGEATVSGVSLVDSINMLIIQVFAALATGGAIVVAQYIGRGDRNRAKEAARQLFFVVTAIGVAVSLVCSIWRIELLRLVYKTVEPAVMEASQEYFLLIAASYPAFAIYNAGAALFRAQGNSRVSMMTALMMNILNIGGNAIFLFVFDMGAFAVGLGTMLGRVAGAAVMLWLIRKPGNLVSVEHFLPYRFEKKMVATILRIGVPTGMENGMFQFGKLLVAGLVSSFGTAAISANAVSNSISNFACIPGQAVGLAMITVVGQCIGAGEYGQARTYTKRLLGMAYLFGGSLNVLMILLMKPMVTFFPLSPEALRLGYICATMHAAAWLVFWPTAFVLPNGLRAAGDVKFTMGVSVIIMWTCRIGLSYVYGVWLGLGLIGVWLAMISDWVVRTAVYLWRFHGELWLRHHVV